MFGFLSTDAAVNSNTSPSQSSSINDISSMSTEQTLASDTDSSLDALTGPLEGCRWSATIADLTLGKNSCFHWAWIACKLMEPSRKTPCSACSAKVMPVVFFFYSVVMKLPACCRMEANQCLKNKKIKFRHYYRLFFVSAYFRWAVIVDF